MTRVPQMMWVVLGCILMLALLSGCGSSDVYRGAVATHGAEAADDVLETSVWGVCMAATIGAVRRAYGDSRQEAEAYADFCNNGGVGTADLIADEPAGN